MIADSQGTDVTIGFVKDGKPYVYDYWADEYSKPKKDKM